MGDAALGGALAIAILGDTATRPIRTARGYGLTPWTIPDTTILLASYDGETEETLAAYDAAEALGARRVVVTSGGRLAEQARADGVPVIPLPGGFTERGAIGYFTVAALEVAALCGAAPKMASEVDVAAPHLDALAADWGPGCDEGNLAKELARALHATTPLVAGAGITAPVAYRWKTQLNANAKLHAFAGELPELNHHELDAWDGSTHERRFSAVLLDDVDLHPRVRSRMASTVDVVAGAAASVHRVETRGATPIQRALGGVLLADLVSLYVAVLRGVDPRPTPAADALKATLATT